MIKDEITKLNRDTEIIKQVTAIIRTLDIDALIKADRSQRLVTAAMMSRDPFAGHRDHLD
jgi:hypothetical protein